MGAKQLVAANRESSVREAVPGALEAAYSLGRKAWPQLALSYERFCEHAAQHASTNWILPAYPADLYVCAACASGETAAYRALEAEYFPALERVISQLVRDRVTTDEVLQEIRTRLFVSRTPKIASYRGCGTLAGWLRSLAVNAAHDRLRANISHRMRLRKLANAHHSSWTQATPDEGSDLLLPNDTAQVCNQAWHSAVSSLSTAERQLLHHYFVSGLSIDVLGPVYGVHRATVHRRIGRAIARVRQLVRKSLNRCYQDMNSEEIDALAFRNCCELDLGAELQAFRAA